MWTERRALVQRELPVRRELPVLRVRLVWTAQLGLLGQRVLALPALRAFRVRREPLGLMVLRELPGPRERRGPLVWTEPQVLPERRVWMAQQGLRGRRERQGQRGRRVWTGPQELRALRVWALRALRVRRGLPAQQEPLVLMALQG